MKQTYLQANFTGGELSPRVAGRVDIAKYRNGLLTCENFQVIPHGGLRKRSGTRFVAALKDSSDVVLVPFQYNVEQAYVLVFGPEYVWFGKDRGLITTTPVNISAITQANPAVVTTSSGHGMSDGQRVILTGITGMSELNNRQFVANNCTGSTFELLGIDSTGFDAYVSDGTAGRIIELTTLYQSDDLAELTFAQTHDVLYIAHKAHPLRKLSRTSHTAWTLSDPSITTGPFRTINANRLTVITPSAFSASATGYGTHIVGTSCTLTASSAVFDVGMVGALFRLNEEGGGTGITGAPVGDSTRTISVNDVYTAVGNVYGIATVSGATHWTTFGRVPEHESGTVRVSTGAAYFDSDFLHPGYCVVRITGYTSSTVVAAEIVRYQMPESVISSGTSFWEEGAWSSYRGYPRAIAFHENRLWLGGSDSDPSVLWSSRSGSYEDFEDGDDDDDAIVYRISTGQADVIRWMSAGRVLTVGTSTGEFAIAASNNNEALTPSNFKASPQTTYGTSKCPPVRVNQVVLYPQRNGDPDNAAKKLREFAYQYESDSFGSTDITIFSEHIMGPGFDRVAYQLEPDSLILARRTDGLIAQCTYERTQEVVAWSRIRLAGPDAAVETFTVIPGADGDEVWMQVERTVDSGTVRYLEIQMPHFPDDGDKTDAVFVDGSLSYSGTETSTISGLYHLRGEAVDVLADGAVTTATVDADGRITLTTAASDVHIGYAHTAKFLTMDIEAGAQAGTAQSRAKRISQVYPRFLNSLGGSIGPTAAAAKPIAFRTGSQAHGASPPLFTGLKEVDFPGGWEDDGTGRHARVYFEHSDPLPCHITGLVMEVNTTG